jgi:hypothetical protein
VVKDNGKVVPVHAMQAYRGRRGIAPLILNLSVDGVEWLSSHLGYFTPRERTTVLIEQEAQWTVEPVWTFWSIKYLLLLLGFESWTVQPVATTNFDTLDFLWSVVGVKNV